MNQVFKGLLLSVVLLSVMSIRPTRVSGRTLNVSGEKIHMWMEVDVQSPHVLAVQEKYPLAARKRKTPGDEDCASSTGDEDCTTDEQDSSNECDSSSDEELNSPEENLHKKWLAERAEEHQRESAKKRETRRKNNKKGSKKKERKSSNKLWKMVKLLCVIKLMVMPIKRCCNTHPLRVIKLIMVPMMPSLSLCHMR